MTGIRVAILDDHEVVLEGLSRTLERAGFEVVLAAHRADDFLEQVRTLRPDLCVIDLRLGTGDSGVQVTRNVMAAVPQTRVAVLTSSEDPELAAQAIQAGATGFVIKDSTTSALVDRLAAVARGDLTIDSRVSAGVLASPGHGAPSLTAQEITMLRLVADGSTNQQIARQMNLSPHTIKEYLAKAMRKLGTRSRAETVARAMQEGLL